MVRVVVVSCGGGGVTAPTRLRRRRHVVEDRQQYHFEAIYRLDVLIHFDPVHANMIDITTSVFFLIAGREWREQSLDQPQVSSVRRLREPETPRMPKGGPRVATLCLRAVPYSIIDNKKDENIHR